MISVFDDDIAIAIGIDSIDKPLILHHSQAIAHLGEPEIAPHLVDFVLDQVLPWRGTDWNLKILDPACGSGVFLVKAFQRLANLATKEGVEAMAAGQDGPFSVQAPLIDMTKAEIIRAGQALGVDYGMTWSCYDPQPGLGGMHSVVHCGQCDSCQLRKKGFDEAGATDPTVYAA